MTTLEHDITETEDPEFTAPTWVELARVGFSSLESYKLWCKFAKLDDGLGRAQGEGWLERHLGAALEPRFPLMERRPALENLVEGERAWGEEIQSWIADEAMREAFWRLVMHVDGYMSVMSSRRLYRRGQYRHLVFGLLALARQHRHWIRPLEAWRCVASKGGHPRRSDQFYALVRYLLARYDVPGAMVPAWFEGVGERGLQQQAWFLHLANGGSIRTIDAPIKLTKKMAHAFWRTPRASSVEKHMRWAQIVGMGGHGTQVQAIMNTRIGRQFDDDDFWSGVVLFFVNNPMMDPAWIGPVVDYIHHMKFAPRRIVPEEGDVIEGPPLQPNFTMKGRSATKLLRQVEAWHGELGRERDVTFQTWPPCGVRPWTREDETPEWGRVRWTVREILSSDALAAEGRAMHHCVVSYADQCADGQTAIWSIGAQREGSEEREGVLTVALDTREWTVTQARGRYNALPNKPARAGKAAKEGGGYLDLLNRSEQVMKEWMSREKLRLDA